MLSCNHARPELVEAIDHRQVRLGLLIAIHPLNLRHRQLHHRQCHLHSQQRQSPEATLASHFQASLREKRSGGHLGNNEGVGRRNSTVRSHIDSCNTPRGRANTHRQFDRLTSRRPSVPMAGHHSSLSVSSFGPNNSGPSNYAPSVYAQSTLAASTVMPQQLFQPVRDDERTKWVEGHCLARRSKDIKAICTICDERFEEESFRCTGKCCFSCP